MSCWNRRRLRLSVRYADWERLLGEGTIVFVEVSGGLREGVYAARDRFGLLWLEAAF